MNRIALATLALAALPQAAFAEPPASEYRDERVHVRLLSEHTSVRPGSPVPLGLRFDLADHWHVYWRNPGDSGEPPSLRWTLPPGFRAGEIEWPLPETIRTGSILNYGYSERVLLPIILEAPQSLGDAQAVPLKALARWLACREEECIPGEAELSLSLPVAASEPRAGQSAALFAEARAKLPSVRDATLERDGAGFALTVPDLRLPRDASVDFLPYERNAVAAGGVRVASADGDAARVALAAGDAAAAERLRLPGVLVVESAGKREGFAVDPSPASRAAQGSLWLALALALAGGAILNLMPCVFPVLSLKVLGFVEQAGGDPRRLRVHGWVFTLGVLVSFWVLAGALLLLRSTGQSLGWGFQLQSPAFLAALTAVVLLLALNLSGVYEIGQSLTSAGSGRVDDASGLRSSFWTGALATIIATPCTAPFMGSALGFALTQPAVVAMLVFTALGMGMALPYLVLSYMPRLLVRLPRPGAWMEAFRQLLAFPLYATVLWLLYVFSRQTGDGVWRLAAALLLLSMAAWTWGLIQRRVVVAAGWRLAGPLLAIAALALVGTAVREPRAQASAPDAAATATGELWQPWSPERVGELRAAGKPVFVNFTADWCLSCQVNERVVFASDAVRRLFSEHAVTALKADWTNEDPRIADTLASFGRDGIPLYVFYPADGGEPQILPQVPTHGVLRDAFAAESSNHKPTDRSDS